MMTVAIVDDEKNARLTLRELLAEFCPKMNVVGEADGVDSGLKLLEKKHPDILFLDIQMNDGTGFDLLDQAGQLDSKVVFATAFDQFAVKAFRYHAFDYLVKPIDPDELKELCRKLRKEATEQLSIQSIPELLRSIRAQAIENLALSTSEGHIYLKLDDIIRLESNGNYTLFYSSEGDKIMVSRTLGEFGEILPDEIFYRTHQSHIVNLRHVRKVLREDGGYALMSDGAKVSISRRRKDDFLDRLGGISL